MFGELSLLASLALIVLGAVLHTGGIAGLGWLLLLTAGAARIWRRWSLWGVEYRRSLSERRAFVGEDIHLTVTIENKKLLPLVWLEFQDDFPEALTPRTDPWPPSGVPTRCYLERITALGPYERVSWYAHLECRQRGLYRIGPLRMRSGDPFGFFTDERRIDQTEHIWVYPRTLPLGQLGLTSEHPFGDVRGGRTIFEDPSRVAGIRDYRWGDPLRRIHWGATARQQRLQSKVYEPTVAPHILVALNTNTIEPPLWGYDPEVLERAVIVAASVARYALESRAVVSLLSNGSLPDLDRPIRVAPSRHPQQLTRVLEMLTMIQSQSPWAFEEVLEEDAPQLPWGTSIVVVSALMPASLRASLQRLRAAGHRIYFLQIREGDVPADWEDITVYPVGQGIRLAEAQA